MFVSNIHKLCLPIPTLSRADIIGHYLDWIILIAFDYVPRTVLFVLSAMQRCYSDEIGHYFVDLGEL